MTSQVQVWQRCYGKNQEYREEYYGVDVNQRITHQIYQKGTCTYSLNSTNSTDPYTYPDPDPYTYTYPYTYPTSMQYYIWCIYSFSRDGRYIYSAAMNRQGRVGVGGWLLPYLLYASLPVNSTNNLEDA